MDPYVGKYFSVEYIRTQVLKQTAQEQKEIDKQIESEMESGVIPDPSAEMDPSMDPNAAPPEEAGGAPKRKFRNQIRAMHAEGRSKC